jgi:hypothetical protein
MMIPYLKLSIFFFKKQKYYLSSRKSTEGNRQNQCNIFETKVHVFLATVGNMVDMKTKIAQRTRKFEHFFSVQIPLEHRLYKTKLNTIELCYTTTRDV